MIANTDILYTKFYNAPQTSNTYNFTKISNDTVDLIEEFIFIVDMPNMGGGVTFFMDTIMSYYKKNTTFVIARSYDKMLRLFINNEYQLENSYNLDESLLFIEKYQHKINKILFNHIISHDMRFIKQLLQINKHTTYITHDYYNICNTPQAYFNDIAPKHKTNKHYLDLNSFDAVITQNDANLPIFTQYYKKPIDVIELPDFKKSNKLVKTANNEIVIGIIGAISIEKGRDILENIVNFYKDSNVTFIVFGYVEIKNFSNVYRYNNIKELNDLLITHKPNMLLELSIWPETYSYTLSLAMLTQLPILYSKKRFKSVVENRLSNYKNKYGFNNYKELDLLIKQYKQDFLYTIEENVYFDAKWNNYFAVNARAGSDSSPQYFKNICGKNIMLITSKIIVSANAFSYVKKRSFYSRQERMAQTIRTINSIRKHIPDSHIVLVDNSCFYNFEKTVLSHTVDTFINITDDRTLNYYTDVFQYKAFGEISQQLQFLNLFLKEDYSQIKNFFKITGRYEINDTFKYTQYDNNLNIFKKHLAIEDRDYYFTCFYKLAKDALKDVHHVFTTFVQNKEKYMNNYSDLEVIFPNAIIDKISVVENLGIVENIGVWKKITNI